MNFICASDLDSPVTFQATEQQLTSAFNDLPHSTKTSSWKQAFCLKNREAERRLWVSWKDKIFEYLGITLDWTLTYKRHCLNTKQKVSSRNNICRKLTRSDWNSHPQTIRVTVFFLCYSIAPYASAIWHKSACDKQMDIALIKSCRNITGSLKHITIEKAHYLTGIVLPEVCQNMLANNEWNKATHYQIHPFHGH